MAYREKNRTGQNVQNRLPAAGKPPALLPPAEKNEPVKTEGARGMKQKLHGFTQISCRISLFTDHIINKEAAQ